jgi:beta-lactam-binding protein with PASTA domain
MKTTDKKIKDFDTVKFFREIKNKVSKDIQGMTFEQLKQYLEKTKLKSNQSA